MSPSASRKFFEGLPEHERLRYAELLHTLERLRLGCRCEQVGTKDFVVTVGYGLASAKFWLDIYGLSTGRSDTTVV